MTPVLQASALSVALGGRTILHAIGLEVGRGEVVGLVGPNGAGKTTLVRSLATLQPPTAGEVRILGEPARAFGRGALARAVAYLPQSSPLHWDLTVEDVVMLGRLPHVGVLKDPAEADRAAVAEAMAETDIVSLANRRVGQLSGGERTRVLLARTLAVEAPIVLADEPVAGLDPGHRLDVLDVLCRRAGDGTAVVIVLHDLTLAMRYCGRLVLLSEGRIVAEGAPEDVLTEGNLETCYGVRAHRGEAGGRPFIVPLERVSPGRPP